jgi:hypothetical protein
MARLSTITPSPCLDTVSTVEVPQHGTRSRLEPYLLRLGLSAALVAFLSFCAMWVQWQSAPGVIRVSGDFVSFWTAGKLALAGRAAEAYQEAPHFVEQMALHGGPRWPYLAFFYPPFFMLLCAGLALLGYFSALCVWLVTTCACYAAAMRALLPRGLREEPVWLLLMGYPAVMVNAGFGQNGFLSTALLGGAAVWLDRRPVLAGMCLGGLAYKPQLGIIVPLALVVAGRWRCFAAAGATVLVMAAAATLAFGADVWPAFLAGMTHARINWLEPISPHYMKFFITVYGAIRLHEGPLALAYAAQAAVTVTAALMLVLALWRRPAGARSGRAEIAATAACVPFCSPFMLEYDLVILAVPMAWLLGEALRDGFRRGEVATLLAVCLAPVLFKVTLFDNAMKLGAIAAAAMLFAMVLRRMTEGPQPISVRGDAAMANPLAA